MRLILACILAFIAVGLVFHNRRDRQRIREALRRHVAERDWWD